MPATQLSSLPPGAHVRPSGSSRRRDGDVSLSRTGAPSVNTTVKQRRLDCAQNPCRTFDAVQQRLGCHLDSTYDGPRKKHGTLVPWLFESTWTSKTTLEGLAFEHVLRLSTVIVFTCASMFTC